MRSALALVLAACTTTPEAPPPPPPCVEAGAAVALTLPVPGAPPEVDLLALPAGEPAWITAWRAGSPPRGFVRALSAGLGPVGPLDEPPVGATIAAIGLGDGPLAGWLDEAGMARWRRLTAGQAATTPPADAAPPGVTPPFDALHLRPAGGHVWSLVRRRDAAGAAPFVLVDLDSTPWVTVELPADTTDARLVGTGVDAADVVWVATDGAVRRAPVVPTGLGEAVDLGRLAPGARRLAVTRVGAGLAVGAVAEGAAWVLPPGGATVRVAEGLGTLGALALASPDGERIVVAWRGRDGDLVAGVVGSTCTPVPLHAPRGPASSAPVLAARDGGVLAAWGEAVDDGTERARVWARPLTVPPGAPASTPPASSAPPAAPTP